MAAPFPVKLISPDRILFDGEAEMVACRTEGGEIAFLARHVPLVGALDVCQVRVIPPEGGTEQAFAAKGGFVEVRGNTVTVLSDAAIAVSEVDADFVARARAEAAEAGGTPASSGGSGSDDAQRPDGAEATGATAATAAAAAATAARAARWVRLLEELERS